MSFTAWRARWKTPSSTSSRADPMTAAAPHRHERAAAAAIFATAAAIAAWILLQRPAPIPLRVAPSQPAADSAPESPSHAETPSPSGSLAFELVELPAPAPAPIPAPADAAPPAPAPLPPVQVSRVEAPPPAEKPLLSAAAPPVLKPLVPLIPVEEPPVIEQPPTVTPLHPEAAPLAEVIPLAPAMEERRPAPQAKPVTPLQPGDEKPSPRPAPPKPLIYVEEKPPAPPPQKAAQEPAKARPALPVEPRVAKVESPPPPAPKAASQPITDKEVATDGRVLLRMFEQGAGPSIEIRWPSQAGQRDRLYDVFVQCLGMRVGILDDQGHLYLGEGPRNQALTLNTDKYSGFVRRPEGAIAEDEQREIARIRAYHASASGAPPARMFPRRVDSFLIGGLRQAVGDQYLKMNSIRAAYRLNGGRVMIESIVADGRQVDGAIDLSTVASCSN